MRLLDCFSEVISFAVEFNERLNKGENIDYFEVRNKFENLLDQNPNDFVSKNKLLDTSDISNKYSDIIVKNAKYPVVAFIDETIINSKWKYRNKWKLDPLQLQIFKTNNATYDFYRRLKSLKTDNAVDNEVREVYHLCLLLGFTGKYRLLQNKNELDDYKNMNYKIFNTNFNRLFPTAYIAEKRIQKQENKKISLFFIFIPILSILILYIIFQNRIDIATEQLSKILL